MLTNSQVADIRSNFPILGEKTYLYSCSQGALSAAVEGGFADYLTSWRTSTAPWDESVSYTHLTLPTNREV